jgi:hypothetical protein
MSTEKHFYDLQEIFDFLGFDYKFDTKQGYPFNRKPEDVEFSWGQIVIPKQGIRDIVVNKISDIKEMPINEIKMLYQVPFTVKDKDGGVGFGVINQDISLTFRYDKEYKYGDINKSIYEVCFYILENAERTNDFYILKDDHIFTFFSYYIIDNQWGIGKECVGSGCHEKYVPHGKRQCDWDSCVDDIDAVCCKEN